MLYERWRRIADERGKEWAVLEAARKRCWTFKQLARESNRAAGDHMPIRFPSGRSVGFLLSVLRAWKDGAVACPLEEGQPAPVISDVPRGCVHLKLTSGTTGPQRAVAFTASQLMADVDNIVATMGLRAGIPNLGVISMAHSYGFSNLVLPLLLHGIPLLLQPAALPEIVRAACVQCDELVVPAVPALWKAWLDAGILDGRIRLAISAGAPLPLNLERQVFERTGIKIHNFYGATECGGIAYDRTPMPRTEASLVGTALDNVRVDVDADGCLNVAGPAVGLSYWPEPSPVLHHGRFISADLAQLKEGGVHLLGRSGDLINVAGRKIAPETIEQALLKHPQVKECLVLGIPGPAEDRSDRIAACVAAAPGVTREDLRLFLLETLPAWQVPREWAFVTSFEPDARGKVSRAKWRRWFAATSREERP